MDEPEKRLTCPVCGKDAFKDSNIIHKGMSSKWDRVVECLECHGIIYLYYPKHVYVPTGTLARCGEKQKIIGAESVDT